MTCDGADLRTIGLRFHVATISPLPRIHASANW